MAQSGRSKNTARRCYAPCCGKPFRRWWKMWVHAAGHSRQLREEKARRMGAAAARRGVA